MTPTAARNSIPKIALTDWKKAASVAEAIPDPWFRCQALATVSLYSPDKNHQMRLLDEAFDSGAQCSERNKVATVHSWPIKALYRLGYRHEGDRRAIHCLEVMLLEPSPVRRADALKFLLGATVGGSKSVFWRIYDAFFVACTTKLLSGKKNSKGQSILAHWAGLISRFDSKRGKTLLDAIEGPHHRKLAIESLERAKTQSVDTLIVWPNL